MARKARHKGCQDLFRITAALAIMLGLGGWTAAQAGTINIGTGAGTANATGTAGVGDPNVIGSGGMLSIALQGSATANQWVQLALVLPTGDTYNPLGSATLLNPYTGGTAGGMALATGAATAASGTLTSGPLSSLLPGYSPSDNFANFAAFDSSLGLNTTSFSAVSWTVALPYSLAGHTGPLINVTFPGGEPAGSIFVALTDTGRSTVWTNAGGVSGTGATSVPEMPAWVLLAAGLALLGLVTRRRLGSERLLETA
ncbi:MAG: hypothetical protein ACRD2F_12530 [Terriglobales bacterium]